MTLHPLRVRDARRRELAIAVGLVAAIVAIVLAAFTSPDPFADTRELQAAFSSTAQIRTGSEVRVGGQKVGTVSAINPGHGHTSVVSMELDTSAPAVRMDATLKVRPRLALEGNAYVDLRPGSPSAQALGDDTVIPLRQTSIAVQLDQVISTFTLPTRKDFQGLVREIGGSLTAAPHSPRAPRPGSQELRRAIRELDRAFPSARQASRALRGERPGDLPAAVRGTRDVAWQLADDPAALAGLISGYARVSRTLANSDASLGSTISELARTVETAPEQLAVVRSGLPELTRFARSTSPALRVLPGALRSFTRAADQLRATVRPAVLPRTLELVEPVLREAPTLQRRAGAAAPQATAIGRCLADTMVPALNSVIPDGRHTTDRPIWQEALHMAAALAGAASSFDANGGTLRLGITEGEQAVGINPDTLGPMVGWIPSTKDVGLNPTWLGYGVTPTWRPDVPCAGQRVPDFAARRRLGLPSHMKRLSSRPPAGGDKSADGGAGALRELLESATPERLLREAIADGR